MIWQYRYTNQSLCLELGEEAKKIVKTLGDEKLEARLYNRISVVYRGKTDLEKSMQYATMAFKKAEAAGDSVELGFANNNIGGTFLLKNFTSLAIEHIAKALTIFQSLNNKRGMSYGNVELGAIYLRQQNYDKALFYFNTALAIRKEIGDTSGIATALISIGRAQLGKEMYQEALSNMIEASDLAAELKDEYIMAVSYEFVGKLFLKLDNFPTALKYQKMGLELSRKIGRISNEISGYTNIILIYAGMKDFAESEKNMQYADGLLKQEPNSELELDFLHTCAEMYKLKGDFKRAYGFMEKYNAVRDSLIMIENITRGNELEVISDYFRAKRINDELSVSVKLQKTQRTYLIIIAVLLLAAISYVVWRYQAKKAANKKLSELNALKDLLFGIIAHDLKNPFQSILGSTELLIAEIDNLSREEIKKVAEMIQASGKQTYRLLENLLYWSLSQTGKIQYSPGIINLSEIVEDTIALHSVSAQSKNISLAADLPGSITAYCDKEMIKLVLRNLVSNAIKYTNDGGSVNILVKRESGKVEVSVEDNGVGISLEDREKLIQIGGHSSTPGTKGEKGTGLGLLLCKEFIEKNKGSFIIESRTGGGSRFAFTLPEEA